jgi:hypothetical protein
MSKLETKYNNWSLNFYIKVQIFIRYIHVINQWFCDLNFKILC